MINTKIRQLEDSIIQLLNESDVPIEAKRFVLLHLTHLVEKEADKAILNESRPITEYGENYAESVE